MTYLFEGRVVRERTLSGRYSFVYESVPSVVAALYVNDRCSFVYEVSRRLQGESAFRVVGCVSIS